MSEDVNVKITVDASQANKSTDNFRQRVKELKDEMTRLQLAGKENTAEYAAAAQELGKLTDAMGDTATQAKILSDDFFEQKAAMEGLSVGVNVFSGLTQAAALFGVENEDLMKTLVKLQAVQNLANTAMNISKALNKDTALMVALRSKAQKFLNTELVKTNTTETAGVGVMSAYTAGETAATTAAGALTTGVKAVGAAIKSLPLIGWVLAAIAAVTTLITLIKNANDEEAEGNRLRDEHIAQLNEQIRLNTILNSKTALALNNLSTYSNILSDISKKGSQEWVEAVEKVSKATGISTEYLNENSEKVNEIVDNYTNLTSEQEKLNGLMKVLEDTNSKRYEIENNLQKTSLELAIAKGEKEDSNGRKQAASQNVINAKQNAYNKAKAESNQFSEDMVKLSGQVMDTQEKLTKLERKSNEYLQADKDYLEDINNKENTRKKSVDDRLKKEREYQELVKNNLSEIEGLEKFIADETKKFNDETLEGKLANIDAEEIAITNLYDDALDKALKYYGEESEEVRKLNELRAQSLNSLETKRSDTKTEDENKKREEKKEEEEKKKAEQEGRDIELAKVKGRLAVEEENSEDFFKLKQEELRIETENEIAELQSKFDNELISYDLFEAEKYRISQEYLHQKEELEKESQKAINEEAINLYNERLDKMGELQNAFSDMVTALQDAELANAEGNEEEQAEIKKKYARMQFLSNIASIGINTAKGIVAAWASAMELAFPYNLVVGGMLTAMLAATGAAQSAKAHSEMNNVLKAEKGGLIKGKTHKSGGERVGDSNLEVENGEYIVNRRSTAAFMPLLEAVNAYNGTPAPRMNVNSGQQTSLTAIDQSVIKEIVKETVSGVASIPVTVLEHSISKAQRNVRVIETNAIL